MKRYVFLTNSVRNVGGSQLYMERKKNWLESIGWVVDVFFYNEGSIVIEGLKQYRENRIPQLSLPFSIVSNREKKRIADIVCKGRAYEKIIFESNEVHLCLWGEYFAFIVGGMNLCYPLSENFPFLKQSEKYFFEFKLSQNLLYGITPKSIPMLLGNYAETQKRYLPAVGGSWNNVSDEEDTICNHLESGVTILSIGRLDKPYISPMIHDIALFSKKHYQDHFNIILIGDAAEPHIKNDIINTLQQQANITPYCTGYINPVPRSLIRKADVAIASAGCVRLSAEEKILTISVDGKDLKAIGVFGITTNKSLYRNDEPQQDIKDMLEDIIYTKKYKKEDIVTNYESKLDFSRHREIIDNYAHGDYYNINGFFTFRSCILKMLYNLLGYKMYKKIMSIYGRLRGFL